MADVRRDPALRFFALLAVVVAVGAGAMAVLTSGGDDEGARPSTSSTSSTIPPDESITCPGAAGRPEALRDCLEQSIAFIETDLGRGTGVLLPAGHIITNAHVVDPFGAVDVTFPGGERHEAVPVVGVDAFTDIAVLGPIESEHTGIALDRDQRVSFVEEPEVFLVGYPGGVEGDDPHVTLARGILSRTREVEAFDVTYLQTDAAIAGGQSGGALVDGEGRVLGISGLGFTDAFALALSTSDVLESVERIFADGGDERNVVPDIASAASFGTRIDLPFDAASAIAVLPASDHDRTVQLFFSGDRPILFEATTFAGDPLGTNLTDELYDRLFDLLGPDDDYFPPIGFGPPAAEVAPDTWEIEVPADQPVRVQAQFLDGGFGTITVDTTEPYVAFPDIPPLGGIGIGDHLDVVVDGFTLGRVFGIILSAGDTVEIAARSTAGDPAFTVVDPSGDYDPYDAVTGDDGGGGLYDLDAVATFTAPTDGRYYIVLTNRERFVSGYELSVTEVDP